jgi:hypothetical protein
LGVKETRARENIGIINYPQYAYDHTIVIFAEVLQEKTCPPFKPSVSYFYTRWLYAGDCVP